MNKSITTRGKVKERIVPKPISKDDIVDKDFDGLDYFLRQQEEQEKAVKEFVKEVHKNAR